MMQLIILITLIVSIMAISEKRLIFIIRVFLSSITAFFLIQYVYGKDLEFWTPEKWDYEENYKILIHSGLLFKGILWLAISYVIFYIIIRYLFSLLIKITIGKKLNRFYHKINDSDFEKAIKLIYVSRRFRIFKNGVNKLKTTSVDDIKDFNETVNNNLAYLSHFIITWFMLGINNNTYMVIAFSIATIIVIAAIIFVPIIKTAIIKINKIEKITQNE